MELGSYSERQRQRDPLNVEQEPPISAFNQGPSSRSTALRSAFAGGWLGGGDSRSDTPDDGEFISGYSPYDVAYRGQAYGDSALMSRTPPPDLKARRFVFLLVGGLIATASVYFLYNRAPQPGLLGHTEGDPCVVDRSEACSAYPFYGGFNANLVRMIDADTTTKNFLFRSAMPLDPETHNLTIHKVQMAAAEQAANNGLQLPPRAKMLFFTLEWDGYNGPLLERCEIAREACQARQFPGVGTVHWPIYGQNMNPFRLAEGKRAALARTFVDWDADNLEQKVSTLHQLVHVSVKDNAAVFVTAEGKSVFAGAPLDRQDVSGDSVSTDSGRDGEVLTEEVPVISVIHCHHGVDRTGALTAAYKMRYLGFSLDAVFREARALGQNLVESIYSMLWYCLYLETALKLETAKCYDVVGSHANAQFFTNGQAPHTPPGILPNPLPTPPLTPRPRSSEFLVGAARSDLQAKPDGEKQNVSVASGTQRPAEAASPQANAAGEPKPAFQAGESQGGSQQPQLSPQPQLASSPSSSLASGTRGTDANSDAKKASFDANVKAASSPLAATTPERPVAEPRGEERN
ncbi:hypothetical protein TGGT1_221230 [Toxoplasma gondii GT1]|uniref:Tyrosine specific protein phosphatases domain-containing protein n=3 Tax=Toxoplasma gondii TaxID=5811 RepID=S7ULC3_TOXGG|nr:hypothetical protein TGGT1_221230 [Toxoplasma gondii GT1]KAF4645540.1 hypothetical protein TGRH88_000270 [Toxoplasma gondii]KFG47336.1 putative transmembrane protein [Toxoplasma gondii FOU]